MPFNNCNTDVVKWRGLGKYHIQLATGKNRRWKIYSNAFQRLSLSLVDCHKKVKQTLYRPRQALRVPGGWGSQISRQLAHEGGRVVSPMHQLPLTPQEIFLVLISVAGWVDPRVMVRPEILWKIPVTPLGIKPVTFRIVVQCLNELCYHVPLLIVIRNTILMEITFSTFGRSCILWWT
jgi:hypothetical protein